MMADTTAGTQVDTRWGAEPLCPMSAASARRSAAERSNARIKDPARIDVNKGWCRQLGFVPMTVLLTCAIVVRNLAVTDTFRKLEEDDQWREAGGLAPRTRRRRRRALADILEATTHEPVAIMWSRRN